MNERTPFYRNTYRRDDLIQRRKKIAASIPDGDVALFVGAPATGAFDVFRQYNDFYYLTGTEVPHSYLLISGDTAECTLFLEPLDSRMERSEGPMLSLEDASAIYQLTGIEHVKPRHSLKAACAHANAVWLPNENQESSQACQDTIQHASHSKTTDPFDVAVTRQEMVACELGLRQTAKHCLTAQLNSMRLIKDSTEVRWMRKAGELTARAVNLAMKSTKPGMFEFQLGAIADAVFLTGGATRGGYRPIIATGENIWNAHYFRNNTVLSDGELVIMDYAPDLHYYTSDIGRMWPVNGSYSAVQRELYGFIVEYHKLLLDTIAPGLTPEEIHEEAREKALPLIDGWSWSRDVYRQAGIRVAEFTGHCSHTVGMAVHDNGSYFGRPIEPGLAFALDPQMWVPEENLYIRVEDTVVITEDGYLNVTADACLELDDVERLMAQVPVFDELMPAFRNSTEGS